MRKHFPEPPYVRLRNVRGVRALGTKRVRVVLREPDPDWIVEPGTFDVALFTWFFAPENVPSDIFACGRPQNYMGYCQRLVTRDLDRAERILDPARRARVLRRADRQMAKDVPVIPLWVEPVVATVDSAIRGFVPTFPLLAWNVENWWLDD
jgi:ABC-type transport system substrate-binding protein